MEFYSNVNLDQKQKWIIAIKYFHSTLTLKSIQTRKATSINLCDETAARLLSNIKMPNGYFAQNLSKRVQSKTEKVNITTKFSTFKLV